MIADPAACAAQFDPVGKAKFLQSCDIAKSYLSKAGISYENVAAPAGTLASIKIGTATVASFEGEPLSKTELKTSQEAFKLSMQKAMSAAGYPEKADTAKIHKPLTILILTILVLYVTMVYGPIAAMLVEMFPTRIRYSSMSLPYHIGNGWFGGLLPSITFAMIATNGNIYFGLWYPIIIALVCFVIGLLFVRETRHNNLEL